MDGFTLGWWFRNSKAILIKSANLLQNWPSPMPVTLMEETIYQKPIRFKTFVWFLLKKQQQKKPHIFSFCKLE